MTKNKKVKTQETPKNKIEWKNRTSDFTQTLTLVVNDTPFVTIDKYINSEDVIVWLRKPDLCLDYDPQQSTNSVKKIIMASLVNFANELIEFAS